MRGNGFGVLENARITQTIGGRNRVEMKDNTGFIMQDYLDDADAEKKTVKYQPFEIEFKTPAEHWIPDANGNAHQYDIELQMALKNSNLLLGSEQDKFDAVLSIFFDARKKTANKYLDEF